MPKLRVERLLEQLELQSARTLIRLGARAARRFPSRIGPNVAGRTPHPELQIMLRLRELLRPVPMHELGAVQARARSRRDARVYAGARIPVRSARDLTLDTPAAPSTRRPRSRRATTRRKNQACSSR